MHLAARPPQHPRSALAPPRSVPPRERGGGCLAGAVGALSRLEQLRSRRADDVAHRYAAAVAAVELEALDETRVEQALQTSLRRRSGPLRVEAAMQLAAEHVAERGEQREHLDVERVRVQAHERARRRRPADALCAIELDELAVTLRGFPSRLCAGGL